jgi:hypothetical protein
MTSRTYPFLLALSLAAGFATGCDSGDRGSDKGNFGPGSGPAPIVTVNNVPTMDTIASPRNGVAATPETVNLTNIGIGVGDTGQTIIRITAFSNNQTVVNSPSIVVTGLGPATLDYTPLASGTATITVNVQDDGGTANSGVDTLTVTFDVVVP